MEKHIKDTSFKIYKSKSNNSEMTMRKHKLLSIQHTSPILILTVISSAGSLKKGTTLTINCLGLVNGLNNRKDGYVYFGFYPNNMSIPSDPNSNKIIDFNLDPEYKLNHHNKMQITNKESIDATEYGDAANNSNIGRHFVIEFSIPNYKYIIKDLGLGYGTFVRLDRLITLKDNQLINIGQIFIVVNICDKVENENSHYVNYSGHNNNNGVTNGNTNNNNNTSIASAKANQLKLKVYGPVNNGETFYFEPKKNNISIGRYELADVKLKDKMLTQIHCMINYSDEGWKLMDGQTNKPSTNGTWIYINEEFEMYNRMMFKTNQTIFEVSVLNPNDKGEYVIDNEL